MFVKTTDLPGPSLGLWNLGNFKTGPVESKFLKTFVGASDVQPMFIISAK